MEYSYDEFGRVSQQVTKNGDTVILTEYFTFTEPSDTATSGQVATYRTVSAGMDVTYSYTYDKNGNILTASNGTYLTTYTYDSANQLIREDNQRKGKSYTWTYDNAGNILTFNTYAYTTGSLGDVEDSVPYVYGDDDWGDLLTSLDGQTISYDTIGNPTNDGTRSYTWQHGRQLAQMTKGDVTWTYNYNNAGLRTGRSGTNGTSYKYVYNGSQLVQMTILTGVGTDNVTEKIVDFSYDTNGTPLTMKYGGNTYYYMVNLQGDVTGILDSSGNPILDYIYTAYGQGAYGTYNTQLAPELAAVNPLLYRGYVFDIGTGLYYLQSRYYDPAVGRFINADGLVSTGQGLLGNNMFAYCGNDPIAFFDPCGTCGHRLDFWNDCEDCGGKTIHEKLKNTQLVVSSGYYVSVNIGSINVNGTIECAYDFKGNVQLFSTISFDITSSHGLSISGGSTDTVLLAPDTSFLSGDSRYLGGGVTCPIPNTSIAGSSMDNIFKTSDGYWGYNSTTGVGFPSSSNVGGEIHGGYSYTKPWTKQYNIFDGLDEIVDRCKSWKERQ